MVKTNTVPSSFCAIAAKADARRFRLRSKARHMPRCTAAGRNMMKRAALIGLPALLLLIGCSDLRGMAPLTMESIPVAGSSAPSAPLSMVQSGGRLWAVFPDRSTMTLDVFSFPDAAHLPPVAPIPSIIDKIDVNAPFPPTFGAHALAADGDALRVLYLDREADARLILKMASLTGSSTQWELDVLNPPGNPLALLADNRGSVHAYWAAGGMKSLAVATAGPVTDVLPSFDAASRASIAGSDVFTAYGRVQRELFVVRRDSQGDTTSVVPGAGPLQASLEAPGGALAVLSWDEATRRLLLQEQSTAGSPFSKTTVTLCDGTSSLALLPGDAGARYLMLFDETRISGDGVTASQLSLIAPGSLVGAGGARYRKSIIASGEKPIEGFAAARTSNALYVLLAQGGLKLYRISLREAAASSQ